MSREKAIFIVFVVVLTIICAVREDSAKTSKPAKPTTTVAVQQEKSSAPTTKPVSVADSNLKRRIKNYLQRLSGSQVVIVNGNSEYGFSVDVDYNFGTSDKAAAKAAAVDLIYDILDANTDCKFKWIYVNCMDGKSPIGLIVQYENGAFSTLP